MSTITLEFNGDINGITLPVYGYNSVSVDWFGVPLSYSNNEVITYSGNNTTGGTVVITGDFTTFGSGSTPWTNSLLNSVTSWSGLTNLSGAFNGCTSLTSVPALPTTVTNTSYMFSGATTFNGSIGTWDVTNVSDMNNMFNGATLFNADLGGWQTVGTVANVKTMNDMFHGANAFVGTGIDSWNVTGVTDMTGMFRNTYLFNNTSLGNWQTVGTVANVKNMSFMFNNAIAFEGTGIDQWNVTGVTDMVRMFNGATLFNADLGGWQTVGTVANVKTMNDMFHGANAFVGTGIDSWNVTGVTDMTGMFRNTYLFNNTSLGNWQTVGTVANVKTMQGMFYGANAFVGTGIDSWNVSGVTDFSLMFTATNNFNADLSNWSFGNNSINMQNMFSGTIAFTGTGIDSWNVSGVTNMRSMFSETNAFNNTNLGNWERTGSTVANVKNMYEMFYGAIAFEGTGIHSWNVSGVTNMASMFYGATIFANLDLANWERTGPSTSTLASVTGMSNMFEGATNMYDIDVQIGYKLKVNLSNWNVNAVTSKINFLKYSNNTVDTTIMDPGSPFYIPVTTLIFTPGQVTLPISGFSTIYINAGDGNGYLTYTYTPNSYPTINVGGQGQVNIYGNFTTFGSGSTSWSGTDSNKLLSVTQWGPSTLTNLSGAFNGCTSLTSVPALPPTVTNTSYMFAGATTFNGNVGTWDVTNVSDMHNMFFGANAFVGTGIEQWNVSKVTDMALMFYGAQAFDANLGIWQTVGTVANVKNMGEMFYNAVAYTGTGIDSWNVTGVTDMAGMFESATSLYVSDVQISHKLKVNLSNWNVNAVTSKTKFASYNGSNDTTTTDPGSPFYIPITTLIFRPGQVTLPISGFSTINIDVGDGNGYVTYTYNPNSYPNINIGSLSQGQVNISGNFTTFGSGSTQWTGNNNLLSVTRWGPLTLTNLSGAFNGCTSLTSVPALPPTVTNTSFMFREATTFNGNIGTWDVANVKNMTNMFYYANAFTGTGIGSWNVSGVSDMSHMFVSAIAFNADLGGWQRTGSTVANVKNMSYMFDNAIAFEGAGIDSWNVTGVTDMAGMFYRAQAFNADLGGWQTVGTVANVKNMVNMFDNAIAFEGAGIDSWIVSGVTDMAGMFNGAILFNNTNLGNWQTVGTVANVKTMQGMFYGANAFVGTGIDSWNVSKVTNMTGMFNGAILFNNTNLGNWERQGSTLASVADMSYMFNKATAMYTGLDKTFTANLTGWVVNAVTNKTNFLKYSDNTADTTTTDPNSPFYIPVNINKTTLMFTPGQVTLPISGFSTIYIDVGNGYVTYSNSYPSITVGSQGQVDISGDFTTFGNSNTVWTGNNNLLSVIRWGSSTLTNLSGAFTGCTSLTSVPALPPTVTNTSFMFSGASVFNGNIGSWDVTNVSYMQNMFYEAIAFNANLGGWERTGSTVANVKNMNEMFYNATTFVGTGIDLWNVTGVTNFSYMFLNAYAFKNNLLGRWILGAGPINMSYMFANTTDPAFTGINNMYGIDRWDVTSVTNMNSMFAGSKFANPDISYWEAQGTSTLANVTDMANMFNGATGMYVSDVQIGNKLITDLSKWKVSAVTSKTKFASYDDSVDTTTTDPGSPFSYMELIFRNSVSTVTLPISDISSSGIDVDWGAGRTLYNTGSSVTANVTGPVRIYGKFGTFGSSPSAWPSASDLSAVTQWGANTMLHSLSGAFNGCYNLTSVPTVLPPFVTDTSYMFTNASRFTGTGIEGWNVSGVTDMSHMFEGATAFDNNILGFWQRTGSTVANVKNMAHMFDNTNFVGTDIQLWNVSGVSDMSYMFANSKFNNIQIGDWEGNGTLANVKTMQGMFYATPDFVGDSVNSWNVTGVTDFSFMFSGATKFNNIDLGSNGCWTIGTNVNMASMFSGATAFTGTGIYNWNVTGVTDMSNMFSNSGIISPLYLTWSSTANVKNMQGMFSGTKAPNIEGIGNWNVSGVSDMSYMFYDSSFNMPLSSWASYLGNVKTMTGMFQNAKFNNSVNNWSLTAVTDMSFMFQNAFAFNQDLSTWTINTTTPVTMSSMFDGALAFNSNLPWNTRTVTDMTAMFKDARRFNSNLPWDVSGVVVAHGMFNGTIDFSGNGLESWDVRSMTDVSYMFNDASGCYSNGNFIKNLTQWNVSAVTNKDRFFNLNGVDKTFTDPFSPFNFNLYPMTMIFRNSVSNPVKLPISDISSSGIEVDWGAGKIPYGPGSDVSGNVTGPVRIYGNFRTFGRGAAGWPVKDDSSTSASDLSAVTQWGPALTNLSGAFNGCTNLISVPALPLTVTNTSYMFKGASAFTGTDVGQWNVTNVTDMSYMFMNTNNFGSIYNNDVNLGQWFDNGTTANVKNMSHMFDGAQAFAGDQINKWTVSEVTDMSYMFANSVCNNPNLGQWTRNNLDNVSSISNVKNMSHMFAYGLYTGRGGSSIGQWNSTNNVTDMSNMFKEARSFNSMFYGGFWFKLKGNLAGMFDGAESFVGADSRINQWDVSGVTNMQGMFRGASACYTNTDASGLFTTDISTWNVSRVTNPNRVRFFSPNSIVDTTLTDPFSPFNENPMTMIFRNSVTNPVKLPISDISSSGIEVDWGAGRLYYGPGSDVSGNVTDPEKIVRIYGKFGTFGRGSDLWPSTTSASDLSAVTQWGPALKNLSGAFSGCTNLISVPSILPVGVTNTSNMFFGASAFTGTGVSNWNVTNVTDMSNMFAYATEFNVNLNWGSYLSNVKSMRNMFKSATIFNGTVNNWSLTAVTDMSFMFQFAFAFNQNLSGWTINTTTPVTMASMFESAQVFNSVLPWNTRKVTDMTAMFKGARRFNSNLLWDVSGVVNANEMFYGAFDFSGNGLVSWDVRSMTDVSYMFTETYGCYSNGNFTKDLTGWNVSAVINKENFFSLIDGNSNFVDKTLTDPFSPFNSTVPGIPANVTAVAYDSSASITWTAPTGPVSGYDISSNPATTLRSSTGTSFIFTGLTNGTSYTFRVTAKNGLLKGTASIASNSVTPYPFNSTVPGIPANVTAVAYDSSASITWTAPAGTVTGYDISSNPATTLRTSTGTSFIFTGLTNGTSYTFRVTAKNGLLKGTASDPSNPVIPYQPNPLFTDLGTYATQPNPAFKLGSKIYGTFDNKLFSIEGPTYTVLQTLSGTAIGTLNRIGNTLYGITAGSVFAYDTSSAILRTVGTLTVATGYSALDPSGNIYVTDFTGVYKITSTSMTKISSEIIQGALSVSNNVLYGIKIDTPRRLISINLSTFATTTTNLTSSVDSDSAVVDSGKVYFYGRSSNQDIINSYSLTNQTYTTIWNFDLNSNKGTSPVGRIFIDSSSQVLYGICNTGGIGSGTMYSYNLITSTMTVLVNYGQSNGTGPLSIAITREVGNAYVVTGGGDPNITPRIRPRAAGPYRLGQINLPAFVVDCFNHGTKILRLLDDQEVWSPIETLRVGDLVKSYKHGYRAIIEIGKGSFINNPELWHSRMYVGQHGSHEPLYITGGHGLLVDYLTQEEEKAQSVFWGRDEQIIDDKILMVAPVSTEFKGVDDIQVFTYYHFVLENDGDANRRYGVWANGFLTETPSLNLFRAGNLHSF